MLRWPHRFSLVAFRPPGAAGCQPAARSTTCCSAAAMSSTRGTRSAPFATSPSPTGRSPPSRRSSILPTRSKTVDVSGLYVTPGLIDIHAHVYAGTGERGSYAGDNSVYPDGFTFRVGVTTVADAGCAGWRNFEDFKAARHRSLQDPRPRLPQHRRQRHARREVRAGPRRHGGASRPPTWRSSYPGADRRHQDRALQRAGVDAGRARGRGRHAGQHSGDGRLRHEPAGAAARASW